MSLLVTGRTGNERGGRRDGIVGFRTAISPLLHVMHRKGPSAVSVGKIVKRAVKNIGTFSSSWWVRMVVRAIIGRIALSPHQSFAGSPSEITKYSQSRQTAVFDVTGGTGSTGTMNRSILLSTPGL